MNTKKKKNLMPIADFLFEAGMLARTPRAGFSFLGTGKQSVAEHLHRTTCIGYALAMLDGTVDVGKVMKMCLFHDFGEARANDLGYMHQRYSTADENRAIKDATAALPFKEDILQTWHEYEERQSKESLLAKDADQLEFILALKEQLDVGHKIAATWLPPSLKRLKTDIGKKMANAILSTDFDHWWFTDKDDEWWVSKNKK